MMSLVGWQLYPAMSAIMALHARHVSSIITSALMNSGGGGGLHQPALQAAVVADMKVRY
jgi:hypothetical protein